MALAKILQRSSFSSTVFLNLSAICCNKIFSLQHSFKAIYKMKAAYFQNEEGEEKIYVNLNFSEFNMNKILNFERRISETIDIFLERLNIKISSYCKVKMGKKFKLENYDAMMPTVTSFFLLNDKPLPNNTTFKDIFQKKFEGDLKLRISESTYEVLINAPVISQIRLPKELRVGTYVYPEELAGKCIKTEKCSFYWFKKKLPQKQSVPWEECGEGFGYVLKPEDVEYYIKLKCIAKNETHTGPTYEVVSEKAVKEFTGARFLKKRHELTQNKTKSDELRLVTYNILADTYVNTKEAKTSLFTYCDRNILELGYRKDLLLIELNGYNADIICLQEVDRKVFKYIILPNFRNAEFSCFYHEKEGAKEGCVLLYNMMKFKMLEAEQYNFTEEFKTNSLLEDIRDKIGHNLKLKERLDAISSLIQVVVLESLSNNTILVIGNTHLYFHPDADHIRLLQGISSVRILQNKMNTFAEKYPNKKVSLIFCGDFNSTPEEGIYQFLTKGSVESTHRNWTSSKLSLLLLSNYPLIANSKIAINIQPSVFLLEKEEEIENLSCSHILKMDSAYGTPPFTNYTALFKGCLDYIYYQTDHLEVTQTVPIPSEEELSLQTAIPSEFFPSDHVALIADFKLKL